MHTCPAADGVDAAVFVPAGVGRENPIGWHRPRAPGGSMGARNRTAGAGAVLGPAQTADVSWLSGSGSQGWTLSEGLDWSFPVLPANLDESPAIDRQTHTCDEASLFGGEEDSSVSHVERRSDAALQRDQC